MKNKSKRKQETRGEERRKLIYATDYLDGIITEESAPCGYDVPGINSISSHFIL